MASTSLIIPKTIFSFLANSPSSSSSFSSASSIPFIKPLFLNSSTGKQSTLTYAKKKNPWRDPFDDGEDPEMEYGSLFADGKQEEDPRPPDNPNNPYGFLKFPMGFNVEIASLALKVRGDVRRCCCLISGGVYENFALFSCHSVDQGQMPFTVLQGGLLRYSLRYPGVQIHVVASPRGKQTYELSKNVRWANAYDLDDDFPEPAECIDMLGLLKNRYCDMVLSTKLAGLGHAAFVFMTSARDRVSYIYPNLNAAGAGLLLSETFTPDGLNLSEGRYHMYHQMVDWLGRSFRSVPRHPVLPPRVSISRKLKEFVEAKYRVAGAEKGKYIVIHGIESDSKASMQSRGDTDSLLPLQVWAQIAQAMRGFKPVFVIPHEKLREDVEEIVGDDASIVFITTPGQVQKSIVTQSLGRNLMLATIDCGFLFELAALINHSAGVIATNTAAIQLANAREKPSIALFSSEDKGKLFVPNADEKKCSIISSRTGKLKDIDVGDVKQAMQILDLSLALA